MRKNQKQPQRVWIFVADSRNRQDLSDLDHFDNMLWGANPHARKGDLVLIYRKAPYSDFAYVFSATSDARKDTENQSDMSYVIDLDNKVRLNRPVTLKEIRKRSSLRTWSFAKHQQGVMGHKTDVKQAGAWESLRAFIIEKNPSVRAVLAQLEGRKKLTVTEKSLAQINKRLRRQLRVFLSYASQDLPKVRLLYDRLRQEASLDLWFDKESLTPGDNWRNEIRRAIHSSDVILICLSKRAARRRGVVKQEMNWALQQANDQPEGVISIIPVKLGPCEIPKRLKRILHFAELFGDYDKGYEEIVAGLRKQSLLLQQLDKAPFTGKRQQT